MTTTATKEQQDPKICQLHVGTSGFSYAEWMEAGTEMRLLNEEAELLAPSLFVVPHSLAGRDAAASAEWRAQHPDEAARRLDHPLGVKLMTAVRLVTLPAGFPRAAAALNGTGVDIARGDEALMEIVFDNGSQGRRKDFRPMMPIVIHY